jgi:hypothetical protein
MSPTLAKQIMDKLDRLPDDKLEKAMKLIEGLERETPKGTPGRELRQFAGTLSREEADEMLQAVEECRQIEPDAW